MMYWYDGRGEWWMWLFMAIFWIVIIGLVVWGISRMSAHLHMSGMEGGSNALEIAKMRYARGEISQEEFEKIKKNLS
jgi:putative membrane protein